MCNVFCELVGTRLVAGHVAHVSIQPSNNLQVQTSMKGDGHFALFGALEIGHTLESNVFRAGHSPK